MGCNCQPQVNHSSLSAKLTDDLKIITFVFIGFSVLKVLIITSNSLLNDLLLALILYALYSQLSYLMGFFALFIIIISFIFELLYLLQIIQNIFMGFLAFNSKTGIIILIIRLINLVIYFFLLRITFLCSREYKALFVEQKSGGVFEEYQMFTEDFNNSHVKGSSDLSYQRLNNNDNETKGYKPFSGQGQTWG